MQQNERLESSPPSAGRSKRLPALDFTKGALVSIMVFYHWLNYFVGLESPVYRYLRFLTPSFIFITGFLIAHVYLKGRPENDSVTPLRLLRRGTKLFAIVLVLNVVVRLLGRDVAMSKLGGYSLDRLSAGLLLGSSPVTFSALVPISYLLILSALLLGLYRKFSALFSLLAAALVCAALICEAMATPSGYLDMLSIGMLGISLGCHLPAEKLGFNWMRGGLAATAYACYTFALIEFNAVFALQVVGVCLNLLLLFWLGDSAFGWGRFMDVVNKLGAYSLFAYIAQIAILQLLRRGLGGLGGVGYGSLLLGFLLTVGSVLAVDRLRARSSVFHRAYAGVFG